MNNISQAFAPFEQAYKQYASEVTNPLSFGQWLAQAMAIKRQYDQYVATTSNPLPLGQWAAQLKQQMSNAAQYGTQSTADAATQQLHIIDVDV